jgi:hypothetical protein
MRVRVALLVILVPVLLAPAAGAQLEPQAAGGSVSSVPPVIRFAGTIEHPEGDLDITFSLYPDRIGGEPLWIETRTVRIDTEGRYVALLTLPPRVFSSGESRWLGVRPEGDAEQPRVMLVSVPYAMKAADAETIGGKSLAAFVLAGDKTGVGADGLNYVNTRFLANGLSAASAGATATSGTANFLGMFTDDVNLANSAIFQTPVGRVGINTTSPQAPFHVMAGETPGAFFDVYSGDSFLGALPAVYRAARGTSFTPTAVQVDDILGGLAVRGYGATKFSGGRGQVMFRAAENWTDAANGTYLAFATEPLGASTIASERMRITPAGNVGIGTTSPGQLLSVAGTIESTTGGFKFPNGTTQTTAVSLGANTFTGTQTIVGGNLALPLSTKGTGSLTVGGNPFLHSYGYPTNAFVGTLAGGGFATTGRDNSAFGSYSLFYNTTGSSNAAFGSHSMGANTEGQFNAAFGYESLASNTTSSYSAAFGALALSGSDGGAENSAFGYGSLQNNTTASGNAAFGYRSLFRNSTGEYNSAFGFGSLVANTIGHSNAAFGASSMAANTSGHYNVAIGVSSLTGNTTGHQNSAIGTDSLSRNTTGSSNAAVGYKSLVSNSSGEQNAGIGYGSLVANTTGSANAALGGLAGQSNVSGGHNTYVGYFSGPPATIPDLSYSTAIGAEARVTQSNTLILGGEGLAAVNVGLGTSTPDERLQVVGNIKVGTSGTNGCVTNFAGTGIAGTCSSDMRLKTNVRPFGPVLDRVARLQPVFFEWRASEFPAYHFGAGANTGLIAQDVEPLFPDMVVTDQRGFKMVNYSELPYLTLAAVTELKAQNDALKADNEGLRSDLRALQASGEDLVELRRQVALLREAVAKLQELKDRK